MSTERRGRVWRNALLWVAGVLFVLSMPCVFLGLLGLLGALADVVPTENHQMGLKILRFAVIPLGLSVVVLVVALMMRHSIPK